MCCWGRALTSGMPTLNGTLIVGFVNGQGALPRSACRPALAASALWCDRTATGSILP